ncbi:Erythromycin 3''-O-methyltransferase [Psilocybe cubensis]|uniref:Erythromycin 3''-O-methyltransferase n=1 Tax=Psilocybe cubensis TaxID=181762 RepID=A0ACB8HGC3_PSICU|nr:Erythromycin 3''-O-methyltransferase [Psilocybe cubensis]KAH9486879.1 Erythromycin 3''-O-methyltransferase [Psilocybe cubensis]
MSDVGINVFLASGVLLFIALLVLSSTRMRSNDPYGLFHLTLNKAPSQDPNLPPATEWLNMGYWKKHVEVGVNCFLGQRKEFIPLWLRSSRAKINRGWQTAHRGKSVRLLPSTTTQPNQLVDSLPDVGHGTGESLLFLLSEPSLPRISHLVGITSLEVHHERSVDRVHKLQALRDIDTIVDLYHADAICTDRANPAHPLSTLSNETFDVILALDCAYHFNTRRLFLEQAYTKLERGGTVALADICFSSDALKTRRTQFLVSVLRLMPRHNVISKEDYVAQMKRIGYSDVVLEDITDDVFPSFSRFLKTQGWGWWVLGKVIDWYASAGARFVIVSGKVDTVDAE